MIELRAEERLVNAMVEQAVKDYRDALRKKDDYVIGDCETFFRSEWFEYLTDVSGELIIEKIKEKSK